MLTAPKTASDAESRLDQLSDARFRPSPADDPLQAWRSTTRGRSFVSLLLLAVMVVTGLALRIEGTHNDLWLDELISLRIAQSVKTPGQVFTAIHNDNNHYLNTLYMLSVQNHENAPSFRYFSVLCGVALIGAGYWLLANRTQVEALILASLLAFSYPLIHFSSEARGYAGALLGSVLACAALQRWLDRKKPSASLGLLYGIASAFAILSHLTSCLVYLPLCAASLLIVINRPQRIKWLLLWVAINLLPGCVLAALYFLDLRFMVPLGADPMSVSYGLSRLLALGVGWPANDAVTIWIIMVPLIALVVRQLAVEHKSGALPTLLATIYLVPLVVVVLVRPDFFTPRYLLVILPFLYVYVAILLARLTGSRLGRFALAAILTLFFVGQAFRYRAFLEVGRGQFRAALEYVSNHTAAPKITMTSNQHFRSTVELGYFAPRVLKDRQLLVYVSGNDRSLLRPEWYIVHQEGFEPPGPAALKESGGPIWRREAYFGASELSGQAWTIYHRQPN